MYLSAVVTLADPHFQAYKHIFTSPSSVEKETKATHLGNALLHGMLQVMSASITYIATQVCFRFGMSWNTSHYYSCRSTFPSLLHKCSVNQTPFLTQRGFICQSWSYSMMWGSLKRSMACWLGGTGTIRLFPFMCGAKKLSPLFRKNFPNQPGSHHLISAKSALGLIKARQQQLNSASANSIANRE